MASWIWLNIPLMVLAFALTVGIPTRMILRDRTKRPASPTPATNPTHPADAKELIAA